MLWFISSVFIERYLMNKNVDEALIFFIYEVNIYILILLYMRSVVKSNIIFVFHPINFSYLVLF